MTNKPLFYIKMLNVVIFLSVLLSIIGSFVSADSQVAEINPVDRFVFTFVECVSKCVDGKILLRDCPDFCKIPINQFKIASDDELCNDLCLDNGGSECDELCDSLGNVFIDYERYSDCLRTNNCIGSNVDSDMCDRSCGKQVNKDIRYLNEDMNFPLNNRMKELEEREVLEDESSDVSWTFEFWAMLGFIAIVVSALIGWWVNRKNRLEALLLVDEIENVFQVYRMQEDRCMVELNKLKHKLKEDFRQGRINESNFSYLLQKLESYIAFIIDNANKRK